MIKISIIEDDKDIRESLAILLNGTPEFSCIATYINCEAAIKNISNEIPDVILMISIYPAYPVLKEQKSSKKCCPMCRLLC